MLSYSLSKFDQFCLIQKNLNPYAGQLINVYWTDYGLASDALYQR